MKVCNNKKRFSKHHIAYWYRGESKSQVSGVPRQHSLYSYQHKKCILEPLKNPRLSSCPRLA